MKHALDTALLLRIEGHRRAKVLKRGKDYVTIEERGAQEIYRLVTKLHIAKRRARLWEIAAYGSVVIYALVYLATRLA